MEILPGFTWPVKLEEPRNQAGSNDIKEGEACEQTLMLGGS